MAINFPASPSVNDTFTAGSITYKWDGDKWIGLGVTPADRLVEGSNSLEITAGNDLVWTGDAVGLKNSSPVMALDIGDGTQQNTLRVNSSTVSLVSLTSGNTSQSRIEFGDPDNDDTGYIYYDNSTDSMRFATNGSNERFRIDSDGRLTKGWEDTAFSGTGQASSVAIGGTGSQDGLQVIRYHSSFGAYGLTIGRSRGGTVGTHGQVLSNDSIGNIDFVASDGANFRQSAQIEGAADGTITSSSTEGKLIFKTAKVNTNSATQAMTIKSNHNVEIHDGNIVFETADTGIDFSADGNASGMTSELLNDYEHGTWTPEVRDNFSAGNLGSQDLAEGFYTKVGNKVDVWGRLSNINTSGMNSSFDFCMAGLPFTATSNHTIVSGDVTTNFVTFSGELGVRLEGGRSSIRLHETASGSNNDFVTISQINSGTADVFMHITYFVD